jgi:YD repeat-containing protein
MRRGRAIACAAIFIASIATSGAQNLNYTYDELGRLREVHYTGPNKRRCYAYDAAGNRVSVHQAASGATTFAVIDEIADEGETLLIGVTRSGATGGSHEISYATANGTATSPADYAAASGTLFFGPGEMTKNVSIATVFDAVNNEPTETLFLNISAPNCGATITDSQGVGSIVNVPNCGGQPC